AGLAALSRPQEHSAHRQVHRNRARPVQRLLEGLTTRRAGGQDPRADVAVERTDPSRRPETETEMDPQGTSPPGKVTSRAITCAVGTSSSCAPAGRPRCQPPSSAGSASCALWALAWPPAQPQMTARWEPEARQAPPCLQ